MMANHGMLLSRCGLSGAKALQRNRTRWPRILGLLFRLARLVRVLATASAVRTIALALELAAVTGCSQVYHSGAQRLSASMAGTPPRIRSQRTGVSSATIYRIRKTLAGVGAAQPSSLLLLSTTKYLATTYTTSIYPRLTVLRRVSISRRMPTFLRSAGISSPTPRAVLEFRPTPQTFALPLAAATKRATYCTTSASTITRFTVPPRNAFSWIQS